MNVSGTDGRETVSDFGEDSRRWKAGASKLLKKLPTSIVGVIPTNDRTMRKYRQRIFVSHSLRMM